MKRIVVFMGLFMILLGGVCFADNNKSTELIDKYKDMRFSLEAGINKLDYQRQYRELYIATKKANGLIPQNEYFAFETTLGIYADINDAWDYQYDLYYPNDVKKAYKPKYPDVDQRAERDGLGRYSKESIVRFLFTKATEKTIALEEFIEKKDIGSEMKFNNNLDDNKTKFGFSYGPVDNDGYITVKIVDLGSIASKAGLQYGDKIGKVNDVVVSPYSIENYKNVFDTAKTVELSVKRLGVTQPIKVTLVKF